MNIFFFPSAAPCLSMLFFAHQGWTLDCFSCSGPTKPFTSPDGGRTEPGYSSPAIVNCTRKEDMCVMMKAEFSSSPDPRQPDLRVMLAKGCGSRYEFGQNKMPFESCSKPTTENIDKENVPAMVTRCSCSTDLCNDGKKSHPSKAVLAGVEMVVFLTLASKTVT